MLRLIHHHHPCGGGGGGRSNSSSSSSSNSLYKGKSLNNRNFIIKCMGKYAQRKFLFRDTKWPLNYMPYRGRGNQAVRACAVALTTWPLQCKLAPWKSNEALFVFCGQRI